MRGLAFPSDAAYDRETSHEYGTPTNNINDIPIDPALSGPVIDPALIEDKGSMVNNNVITQHPQPDFPPLDQYNQIEQYSEGPHGDPFAPQQLPIYFPINVERPISPQKPAKRKRRPARERECGFCQGNDRRNGAGQPESMVTCDECSRSGHPSCMELAGMGDILRSYPWKCIECKTCEICHEKGEDARILFCDSCDRGWHMDCLQPPIEEPPSGKWNCPECPPLPFNSEPMQLQCEVFPLQSEHVQLLSDTLTMRESSVASSSRSIVHPPKSQTRPKGKRKTKLKASAINESDSEQVDAEETSLNTRGKPRSAKKPKHHTPKAPQHTDDERQPSSSPRQAKRIRVQHPPLVQPLPRVRLRLPTQKGKGKEREEDESPKGFFDEILTVQERDVTKTTISHADQQRFEKSRMIAEGQLAPSFNPLLHRLSEAPDVPSTPGPSRLLRSTAIHTPHPTSSTPLGVSASPAPSSTPGPSTKPDQSAPRIRSIRFGQFDIKTWYDAPFPEEYATIPDGRLWICEFCLKYMKSHFAVERHRLKCKSRHPPGDEIYRDSVVSIFEVDGRKNKIYCQNLCLLSKMFLDHKSLFYDVEPFLFYVITELDDFGARFVGYFSKEKRSPKDYNLSCIMTLPVRQRQGWGNLLIDFSYLLSKKEQIPGSPEKPLSSLGALGYKNYWTLTLMRYLETAPDRPRLEDISVATAMTIEDIVVTLTQQNMISAREVTPPPIKPIPGQSIRFPKGRKNGVARRHLQRTQTNDREGETLKGPFVAPTHYEITWDRDKVNQYLRAWEAKGYLTLKPEKLQWSPYLLARKDKEQGELKKKESEAVASNTGNTSELSDKGTRISKESFTSKNDAPFPSPLNIFDDELASELPLNLPQEKRKSPSKSPLDLLRKKGNQISTEESSRERTIRGQPNQLSTPKSKLIHELRTTHGHRTRSASTKPDMGKDELFATQLALEEERPRRTLRSRPQLEDKQASSLPTTPLRTPPPRKRKRIEESSEPEEGRSLPHPPNGKHINGNVAPTSDIRVDIFNGESISLTPSVATQGQQTGMEETILGVRNGALRDDVKSEDLGTPLTNLTGRQSFPSDDTLFTTVLVPNGKIAMTVIEGDGDEDADADADGEYEEDAEGELYEEE